MALDVPERYALVICDAQPDLLSSLEEARSLLSTSLGPRRCVEICWRTSLSS